MFQHDFIFYNFVFAALNEEFKLTVILHVFDMWIRLIPLLALIHEKTRQLTDVHSKISSCIIFLCNNYIIMCIVYFSMYMLIFLVSLIYCFTIRS